MNPDLLKLMIGGVVGAHGIGHVLGWVPAWGIARFEGLSSRSWLLDGLLGDAGSRALGGALWLVPTIGFVIAAAGLFGGQTWWRPLVVASALVSLAAIGLFWDALPAGSRVGALGVDAAVLGALLVLGWPETSTFGA